MFLLLAHRRLKNKNTFLRTRKRNDGKRQQDDMNLEIVKEL